MLRGNLENITVRKNSDEWPTSVDICKFSDFFVCGPISLLLLTKNLYENRMCNQWDNWRAYGPELLL